MIKNYYSFIKRGMLFLCLFSMSQQVKANSSNDFSSASTNINGDDTNKIPIQGFVKDSEGNPIIGATIIIEGTTKGAIATGDGSFALVATKEDPTTLSVSYIGFVPKIVDLTTVTDELVIILEEDNIELEEVVVVGYGTQKKVNLSGSVDQVSSKELEQRPISDISKGLQGMLPSLNIDFTSGEPGQAANINIRGVASINGGSPLILIDGVASDSEELNNLLPSDIESISILKDASSAAIYGARASFGVILITTKTGSSERVLISYNNSFSWKKPTNLTEKTSDPYIYLKLKNIAALNTPWSSGHVTSDERLEWARQRSDDPSSSDAVRLNPLDVSQWDYMGNTDWTNYYLDNFSMSTAHEISISGRTDKTRYYLSGGTNNEKGMFSRIVDNDNYTRSNLRAKVSYDVASWLTLSNNLSYSSTVREKPSYYNISDFYDLEPHNVDVNPDGTWTNTELGYALAELVDGGEEKTVTDRLQNNFSAKMSFLDDMLTVNANAVFSKTYQNYSSYTSPYYIGYGPDDIREEGTSTAYKSNSTENYNVFDVFATFTKDFNKHNLTVLAGCNQEYSKLNLFTAERYNLISSSLPSLSLAYGDQFVNESYSDWAIRGMFYRVNYSYDNKLLFETSGRYDGTSRFPEEKRFGFFPSGSVAWRLDTEPFFENLKSTVSLLKVRLSYGSLGNQQVGEYDYIPYLGTSTGSYLIDGTLQQTVTSPGLVSADYGWETVQTINAGLDLNLFNNKFTASLDVYRRDTKDMLTLGQELPGVLGNTEPMENAADMKTLGWELSLAYRNNFMLASKQFNYSARFVLSDSRSWITKFDNPSGSLSQYYVGQELGEIWGLQSDGYFQSQAEIDALDQTQIIPWGALEIVEGWPKYKDLNGDNAITTGSKTLDDSGDLSIIGNSSSRYRLGLNLSADWNGFDISMFLQGVAKRDVYPTSFLYWGFYQQPYSGGQVHTFDFYRASDDGASEMANHSQSYIDAGLASQNLDSKYPVMQAWLADKNVGTGIDGYGLGLPQTGYLLNGSYLRVKNITVGYTLPNKLTNRIYVSKLRVYVSADNICEWSGLKDYYDPEALTDTSTYGYVYPFNRQITCGVNLTF